MTPPDLATAARLIAALRPDWQRPELFHEMKAEVLDLLRRAAAADRCDRCEALALRERLARAHALLRASAAEADRLRRLLASAAARPPRRRRAEPDPRQAALPLACHRLGDSGATPPSR